MSTIFALSTPWGRSGVALIRISGPGTKETLEAMMRRAVPPPRTAMKRRLWAGDEGADATPLDDAMVTWLPGPASYTGEDMAELGVHGGPSVIAAVLEALGRRPNFGLAEPGEFTRRAFFNGKLDLLEIEGLADLIAAETEGQRRQALRQAEGITSGFYESWRGMLVRLMSVHEASIDFSDEELPVEIVDRVTAGMAELLREIERHLNDSRRGERLRDGLMVSILGAPNAGKSSLLNQLAGRQAAIVSASAGTTRDVIEVQMDLAGIPVTLADTAGLRKSLDEVESEGVRRAVDRARASDLKLLVFDGGQWPVLEAETMGLIDEASILVLNKADLGLLPVDPEIAGKPAMGISALSGDGIADLVKELELRARSMTPSGDGPVVTRARHRQALERAVAALRRGLEVKAAELRGEELRLAATALGRLVGRIDVEEILEGIFKEFCVGK